MVDLEMGKASCPLLACLLVWRHRIEQLLPEGQFLRCSKIAGHVMTSPALGQGSPCDLGRVMSMLNMTAPRLSQAKIHLNMASATVLSHKARESSTSVGSIFARPKRVT